MEKESKGVKGEKKEEGRKVRTIVLNLIRVLLVIAFFGALNNGRNLIVFIAVVAFVVTFLPLIFRRVLGVELPAHFEIIVILFVYGALFFGKVQGFYNDFWWWSVLLSMAAAITLGFLGLAVMYTLYRQDKIHGSPMIIALFSFCFAVAAGTVWEFFEFSVDKVLGFTLQQTGDTMMDLIAYMVGAFAVSTGGYFYIKNGKLVLISSLVSKFVQKNPKLFGGKIGTEDPSREIVNIVEKGEHEKVEFKSTLRTNLHTNQTDKRMEHGVLKTVAAYMNSDGGTLLVGVRDDGEILGIEKDGFPNDDKASLHVNSLVRDNLGGEHVPFVKSEVVKVDGKSVLKVECKKSNKEVFLKSGNDEEFYVRNGPSSVKLGGRALLGYVNYKFRESP